MRHSGGFLLRIMPPSWHPVPACVRDGCCRRNHSSLPLRRLESDAEQRRLNDRSRRNYSSLPLRRLESDADHLSRNDRCRRAIHRCSNDGAASIRKSGLEIKNRCTKEGVNREKLASIRKSGPEIKNRCMKERVNGENLASIPKSSPEIKNRCTQQGINRQNLASILKFGPEIENRCSNQPIFSTHPQHIPPARIPARVPSRVDDVSCLGCFAWGRAPQWFDSGSTAVRQRFDSGGKSGC